MLKKFFKGKAKQAIKELLKEAIKTVKDAEYSVSAGKDGKLEFRVKVKKVL